MPTAAASRMVSTGRLGWQDVTGYGKRALVETAMGRYQGHLGERLRCRGDAARRTEAVVGAAVLNRMPPRHLASLPEAGLQQLTVDNGATTAALRSE